VQRDAFGAKRVLGKIPRDHAPRADRADDQYRGAAHAQRHDREPQRKA
jgi:hypothetical protein